MTDLLDAAEEKLASSDEEHTPTDIWDLSRPSSQTIVSVGKHW